MDQVSEVREKIDLVSLISEYIPLKKMGRNFKANCPFHQEKTPSFVVSPERQIWHCFGCGKGGDAFSFVMEYEHAEFPEALRILAKRAGVTLRDLKFDKGQYSQKENLYKINNIASKFYNFLLTEHKIGKPALDYLIKERKLNLALIKTYSLGFSPHDNSLSKYLIGKKGYKKEDLFEGGLSYVRNGNVFDFFRGRIMFPLSDHRGNIVGFSGRALNNDQPKYINSRDTIIYHKGSLFFGLENAKDEIREKGAAIIVEGEFDALSSYKEGIKNVVAIKGTALTENQATLLSRFTKKVILCLDQDPAGFEATKRSLPNLEKNGMTIDIVQLKDKDPDETLKKNPGDFKKALKDAVGIYDFLIEKTMQENQKTAEGKKNTISELLPILASIQNEVVKEHYLKKLSKEIDSSLESILKELAKIEGKKEKSEVVYLPKEKKGRREILEGYFLSLVLQSEDAPKVIKEEKDFFKDYDFENPAYEKIFEGFWGFMKGKTKFDLDKFAKTLPKEVAPAFDIAFLFPLPKFENPEMSRLEIKRVEDEIKKLSIKGEMEELAKKIEEEKDKAQARLLQKKFSELASLLPRG